MGPPWGGGQPVVTEFTPLLLLAAFQVKHFLGDFVIQNAYILNHRRIWGHPGGLLHVGVHAALSLPVLLFAGVHGALLAELLLGEAVFHYHVDWAKDLINYRAGWTPANKQFWWLTGIDQALHQLSYLVIVGIIMRFG